VREFLSSALGAAWIPEFEFSEYVDEAILADCLSGRAHELLRRNPLEPIVDLALSRLNDALRDISIDRGVPYVRKWFWPRGKPYAVCLTHDADKLSESFSHIWRVRERFSLTTLFGAFFGITNPYSNIERLSSLETRYSVASSFYLRTNAYDLRAIASALRKLILGGWEIGLHFDAANGEGLEELKRQTAELEAAIGGSVLGNRCHYLKFSYPETWQFLDEAGYLYDTTCGFRDEVGFRVGVSLPYHPPDKSWTPLRLLELPLVLMDATLWGYKRLSESQGLQLFLEALDAVSRRNGLFTILWHQEALMMRGGRIYHQILDKLSSQDCWVAKAADVARWWERREATELRLEGSTGRYRAILRSPLDLAEVTIRVENARVERLIGQGSLRRAEGFTDVILTGGNSASIELSP